MEGVRKKCRSCILVAFALVVLLASALAVAPVNHTVEQKLSEDTDLSQFYSLLENNQIANLTMQYRQVTIFAPTNSAFQRQTKPIVDQANLVLYHMTNLAKTVDQLGTSLSSERDGNPPLWVTRKPGRFNDEIYINNAKILMSRSNFVAKTNNHKQVLHVIDDVLIPVLSSPSATSEIYNPNAYQFLNQSESLEINPHRVRSFRQKIQQNHKEDVFNADGQHTFFIPVDEGFKPGSRPEKIDAKVIDGHVIPNNVLFTEPVAKDTPFQTLAFGDNLKVTISFTKQTDGKQSQMYIKSNTLLGDSKHTSGVVLAEIVKANIPVRNGVIHLIHRPLMVVDISVTEFLQEKDDGPVNKFFEAIEDSKVGKQFLESIDRFRDITLFAPSNAAWNDGNLKNILQDEDRMREILNLHLVKDKRLSVEAIIQNVRNNIYQSPTAGERKHLYFNVVTVGNNQTLTVEGGGVNATVVEANIAATNGIIHIIDRVLGVPYTTVLDKLRTDPQLNDTFFLGQRRGFNNQLNDTKRKYTYFVPRDRAWRKSEVTIPSTLKKLFMPEFGYHATQILERHLVVSDIPYTMERLRQMTNETNHEVELTAQRDILRIRVEELHDHTFTIHWKGERIPVFRPNVECTNGVIHVIDVPFLQEGDVRVSSANGLSMAPHLLMLLAAKWLLL